MAEKSHIKVLLVDDDERGFIEGGIEVLNHKGFEVVAEVNGDLALERIHKEPHRLKCESERQHRGRRCGVLYAGACNRIGLAAVPLLDNGGGGNC